MSKPRMIIADTDITIIFPLQLRFVEDFFEQIDLEIITDPEYFDKLFSMPQKIDILIVSENLYSQSLLRHNIDNIFLMTEKYENGETDQFNVNRISKYTSTQEIFNEVTGKSTCLRDIASVAKKEPQIVVIYSAAGGVGKTTVALGMAGCLTQNYKKVLYINAARIHTFQTLINNQTPISNNSVYSLLTGDTADYYQGIKHVLRKESFTYLPPFKASLLSLGISYSVFEKIAFSAKKSGEFDFIIVDTNGEFDDENAALIGKADKVVIVTKQSVASVYSTNELVSNINGAGSDKYIFICNDFNKEVENALISPHLTPKFNVVEYIEHMPHYDNLKAEEFVNSIGMKRAGFLVL